MSQPGTVTDNDGSPQTAERRPPSKGRLRRIVGVLCGLCAVVVLALGFGFFWFISQVPAVEPNLRGQADGIVVLTGGASRITDAVELLAAGHGKRLLISGVHPSASPREIARRVPEYRRIFDCCVDLDHSALNTLGNATQAHHWVESHGFNSLIVVTSAYHMPRAMAELKHQLPHVRLIPYPVVTEKLREDDWWSNPMIARLLVSEYLKYLFAKVRMQFGPRADALVESRFSEMHLQNEPAHVVR